ncbi:MAG TPA: phytanoyl-CoA dioxygenase family protein [Acidimicrobiales bacterium]|nr:phytanoyl-CoA dioxygenase family protein [Acidimicrobiales bacterium]
MAIEESVGQSTVARATGEIELYGYTVIEDAITAERADELAERCRELHGATEFESGTLLQRSRDGLYETLFGLQNADRLCWDCARHPQVLAVARYFLGDVVQLAECCSKIVRPGGARGRLHVDSAHDLPGVLPEMPWLINTMWMLTDFTYENGATLAVPGSHFWRRRPPEGWSDWHMAVPMTGRKGSVAIFRSGIWHASGHNASPDINRVGLNVAYYPAWWNILREANHQPIRPDVFTDMPSDLQVLQSHRVGRRREDVYQ